jgi:hypothetical protein
LRYIVPLVLFAFAAPAFAETPMPADGLHEYVIKRNGEPIGTLKIDFRRDGRRLVAKSNYSIKIKLLSIVLYRYDKVMTETYQDGTLIAYETGIDDNGTKSEVRVSRSPDGLAIVHPKGRLSVALGLLPSTYWPTATVNQTRLIDSSDGVLVSVKTSEPTTENLDIDGRGVTAKRYTMSGDLKRELWYDANDGTWLKLKMKASDGSTLEFERDWPPVWKRDLL